MLPDAAGVSGSLSAKLLEGKERRIRTSAAVGGLGRAQGGRDVVAEATEGRQQSQKKGAPGGGRRRKTAVAGEAWFTLSPKTFIQRRRSLAHVSLGCL